jgi:hypothetical protein
MIVEEAHKWLKDNGWVVNKYTWEHPDRSGIHVYLEEKRWHAIHEQVNDRGQVNTTRFGPIPAHASGESPEAALKALEVVAAEMIVKVRKLYDQLLGIILN